MQKEEQKKESEDSLLCPSFSAYSSDKLGHIADQATRNYSLPQNDSDLDLNDNDDEHNHPNDDSDFEFVAFRKTVDGVFFDRNDGPVFPIFNRDLAGTPPECDGGGEGGRISGAEEIRFSMEKLLIGDEEEDRRSLLNPTSSSSEEEEVDDELDAIPAGTYCVWTPNPVQASPHRCKKSNSTGSSSSPAKRWKLLDLLRRSNSDGKDSLVFLTPSSSSSSSSSSSLGFGTAKKEKEKKKKKEGASANVKSKEERGGGSQRNRSGGGEVAGKRWPAAGATAVSAHEALYVRNREMRRVDKRRTYLPYKQDLVGFCAALNGVGRTFPPF